MQPGECRHIKQPLARLCRWLHRRNNAVAHQFDDKLSVTLTSLAHFVKGKGTAIGVHYFNSQNTVSITHPLVSPSQMEFAAWVECFFSLGKLLVKFFSLCRMLFRYRDLQNNELITRMLAGQPLAFEAEFSP